MTEETEVSARNASLYYPFFQNMFEFADITSYVWQPVLKAIGRTHLEFAGIHARQTRALVHWTHQVTRPATPADFFNANAQLWATMMHDYLDAGPRVAAAIETATETVSPPVLQLAPKTARDTLVLLDRDDAAIRERRVA